MFVVLTGPDRAGKTTLAEELDTAFRFDVRHKGVKPKDNKDAEDTFWKVVLNHVRTGESYLCDRLNYPEELIYPPVFGTRNDNLIDQEAGIVRLLKEVKAYYIYVTADIDTLKKRWDRLGEDPDIGWDKMEELSAEYDAFMKHFPLPFSRIDTSHYNENQAFDKAWRDILYYYSEAVPKGKNWKGGWDENASSYNRTKEG